MSILLNLIDEKLSKLLLVFAKNKNKLYHVTQLAKEAGVPAATTLRLVKNLVDSGFVNVSPVGKIKIYSYNYNEQNNTLLKVLKL